MICSVVPLQSFQKYSRIFTKPYSISIVEYIPKLYSDFLGPCSSQGLSTAGFLELRFRVSGLWSCVYGSCEGKVLWNQLGPGTRDPFSGTM